MRRANQIIVDPDGDLYSCYSGVGDARFLLGNVRDQDACAWSIAQRLGGHLQFRRECEECPFLPMCWGGCAYLGSVEDGTGGYRCERETLERAIPKMIRHQIACTRRGAPRAPSQTDPT